MCVSRPLWWTLLHLWERSQHELPESKIYYTWVLTSWYMSLSLAWSACQHAHMRYDTAIKAKKLPLQFKVTSGLWTLTLAVRKGYPAGIGCLNKGMSSKLCLTLSAPPLLSFHSNHDPHPIVCVCMHWLEAQNLWQCVFCVSVSVKSGLHLSFNLWMDAREAKLKLRQKIEFVVENRTWENREI